MRSRLMGTWTGDIEALNEANRKAGRPTEKPSGSKLTFGVASMVHERDGTTKSYSYDLADDTVWQGDLCRGGEWDAALFNRKHRNDNGTVIVSIEDGDTTCWTIELLNGRRLVTAYVGARLNFHYYKRAD